MRFEKCLTCPSIRGKQCAGPNFMTAPTKEVVEWMIAFQKLNGITNTQWAEKSGVPKGTIDGLKNRTDVRHDTIYPLIKALIELAGGVWGGESCPVAVSVSSEQRQEILRLTEELERAKEVNERNARDVKERTRAIYALFALCAGLIALLLLMNL
jgi:gas vesicle protein